jgi:hypothetical protein
LTQKARYDINRLCTRTAFSSQPYSDWFLPEYKSYLPNSEVMSELKDAVSEELHIVVVLVHGAPIAKNSYLDFLL